MGNEVSYAQPCINKHAHRQELALLPMHAEISKETNPYGYTNFAELALDHRPDDDSYIKWPEQQTKDCEQQFREHAADSISILAELAKRHNSQLIVHRGKNGKQTRSRSPNLARKPAKYRTVDVQSVDLVRTKELSTLCFSMYPVGPNH